MAVSTKVIWSYTARACRRVAGATTALKCRRMQIPQASTAEAGARSATT
jgi:hypothetical protein